LISILISSYFVVCCLLSEQDFASVSLALPLLFNAVRGNAAASHGSAMPPQIFSLLCRSSS
jgi:hypothetical protein